MRWQERVEKELAKPTHTNTLFCAKCAEFLVDVHPELVAFVSFTRSRNKSVHVSCGYRGEKEQNEAFARGASKLKFPQSKHNRKPSHAVDLFTIDEDGVARFIFRQMEHVWNAAKPHFRISWGGNWEKFKDAVHFEVRE